MTTRILFEIEQNDAELHALNYLLEIVEKVNKEPGQYESVQKELTGIFIEFAQNNFVMSNAVEIVFEQVKYIS